MRRWEKGHIMTRNTMKNAGFVSVSTKNGGRLTNDNAMTAESKKAQRTPMFSKVTATTTTGTTITTTKGVILGKAVKNSLKSGLHKIADKI